MAGAVIEAQARRVRPAGVARISPSSAPSKTRPPTTRPPTPSRPKTPGKVVKLSKDAYKRQKVTLDAELTRLGLRKNHLELAIGDPKVTANFVELRRVTSELADVNTALAAAEDAWLDMEERAP